MNISRERRLAYAYDVLLRAYPGTATVRETTPAFGGLRVQHVESLIKEGLAEWVERGATARAVTALRLR